MTALHRRLNLAGVVLPRSAVHGLRWWEVDPTAWAIRALRLAWNVVEISPERQQQKLAT
jgi:stearoyl-CoA desaturase (Delta-9 desaturase)